MHELIVNDWLDHDYIERHTDGWPALRERALRMAARARGRGLRHRAPTRCAAWRATTARREPAAIRLNYGMQRVRGGGNAVRADRASCRAWSAPGGTAPAALLLSSSGWFRRCATTPRCSGPTCSARAAPRTINMSTIGDDLLRDGERSPTAAFGPKIEALVVYNSNPVAVAPESPKVARGFAREDLFTVVLEHFMTDTADYADYVLPATTQLEHLDVHTSYGHTYALINEPAIAPLGEAQAEHADLPRARRAHGLRRRRASPTATRRSRASRSGREAASTSTRCAQHGWVKLAAARGAVRRRRLPDAERQAAMIDVAAASACPTTCRTTKSAASTPELARALSARDDLAAGAQLPQLELRQRAEPARHRGRAGARDPRRRRRAARHRRRRRWCASSTTAAATVCKARASASARGPASSTASASGGASSAPTAPTSTS